MGGRRRRQGRSGLHGLREIPSYRIRAVLSFGKLVCLYTDCMRISKELISTCTVSVIPINGATRLDKQLLGQCMQLTSSHKPLLGLKEGIVADHRALTQESTCTPCLSSAPETLIKARENVTNSVPGHVH